MSTAIETKIPDKRLSVRVRTGGAEVVQELASDWSRLCDQSGDDEIFYRPEWIQAYLSAFAPRTKIFLISVRAAERLLAVLPLTRQRTWISGLPATVLTVPANVHCFRIGMPVFPGEDGNAAVRAVWQAIKELPGWSLMDVSHVVEGNGIDRLVAVARAEGFYM